MSFAGAMALTAVAALLAGVLGFISGYKRQRASRRYKHSEVQPSLWWVFRQTLVVLPILVLLATLCAIQLFPWTAFVIVAAVELVAVAVMFAYVLRRHGSKHPESG